MRLKLLLFIPIVIILASCTSVVSVVENTNSNKKFETEKAYFDFIKKKAAIPNEKIVILKNSVFDSFLYEIASKHLSTYYGIINQNSFASAEQLSNKSCSGQIETLYQKFADGSNDIIRTESSELALFNQIPLDDSKNTLILLYSYKLGGLSRKVFNVIKELKNKPGFDYRIVSLDNADITRQ